MRSATCVYFGGDLKESKVVKEEGEAASGLHATPPQDALFKIPRHRGTDTPPVQEMVHKGNDQHPR